MYIQLHKNVFILRQFLFHAVHYKAARLVQMAQWLWYELDWTIIDWCLAPAQYLHLLAHIWAASEVHATSVESFLSSNGAEV
jgi:hypothetical protein